METHFVCSACGSVNRAPVGRAGAHCGRCKAELDTSGKPMQVDDDRLAGLLAQKQLPVLVDFWAAWCPPCRMLAPILEELGQKKAGHLIIAKVDTDKHKRHAAALHVQSIPTLAFYNQSELKHLTAGARPLKELESLIERYLGSST